MGDLKVMHTEFQKDPMETVGGIPPDGRTDDDGRTDGRKKRSLYAPPFSMGGIINQFFTKILEGSKIHILYINGWF